MRGIPYSIRVIAGLALLILFTVAATFLVEPSWAEEEIVTLKSLWIGSLPPLPSDPSNMVADDPQAATLGHKFFFDNRLSANGEISCATCHQPQRFFTDGLARAQGLGVTPRNTPTIVGTAFSPWLFWDGRKDSQWAQALGPLESAIEHGGNRAQYAHVIYQHYRDDYEAIFGPLPDLSDSSRFPPSAGPVADSEASSAWEGMKAEDREAITRIYSNIGKAIAAYERLIMPGPSRFDRYVEALLAGDTETADTILTPDEFAGLRLFIGEAECTNCHNGPLLTNNEFHNVGVPPVANLPDDVGRLAGVQQVLHDEFNCLAPYSDAEASACGELRFVKTQGEELEGAFRTPGLRNVAETAPYMHAGQFTTLREVLEHYNEAPGAAFGHSELKPLKLSETELEQLEAFLHSLSGPLATSSKWLGPPN